MTLPTFTMRDMLKAGIHFGHHPRRWNPKMEPYLFGVRNNIHIINLELTVPMLYQAMQTAHETVVQGGRILFVGTKTQASDIISESAKQCGQYYVNHRWLGGMMTNWKTVSKSITRLNEYNELLEKEASGFTKKEQLKLQRERNKLERAIGGIREMAGVPDLLFVIDTNKEDTAIKEATKLGIPIIAVVDSNSDPTPIDYPIPGNDDAIRSIRFYCDLMSKTILDGLQTQMAAAGIDVGEAEEIPAEAISELTETELASSEKAKAEKEPAKKEIKAKAEPGKEAAKAKAEPVKQEAKKVETTPAAKIETKAAAEKEATPKKPAPKKTVSAAPKAEATNKPAKKAAAAKATTKKAAAKPKADTSKKEK